MTVVKLLIQGSVSVVDYRCTALSTDRPFLERRFIYELPPTTGLADRLTMPVLMIQGGADKVTPTETDAAPLKAVLGNARLVTLDGYGHLPEFEASDKVNALLDDFLR